jgi:hypothetical protein
MSAGPSGFLELRMATSFSPILASSTQVPWELLMLLLRHLAPESSVADIPL